MEQELEVEAILDADRELLHEHTHFPRKKLRVYLDYEYQRYYIDMSAAFALKLITYNQWISNEKGYYEITAAQLNEFERIYEIVYEYFDVVIERKKPYSNIPVNLEDNMYNEQNKINSNIKNLKDLRDELLRTNVQQHKENYKVTNDIENFVPKK